MSWVGGGGKGEGKRGKGEGKREKGEGNPGAVALALNVGAFLTFALLVPGFATGPNLETVVISALPLFLLAVGQTFVLISAGIDLSSTAVVGLVSVVGGVVMSAEEGTQGGTLGTLTGLAAMLATGVAAGAVNGACVGWLRMPAFMVTLTLGMFAGGLAVWLARTVAATETLYGLPSPFLQIGGDGGIALALTAALGIAAHGLLSGTLFGRALQAVGYNARVALVSGIRVQRVILATYVLGGLFAAFAAVLLTGRLETASPTHGRQLLLDVIGATVIGGTSLSGGRGRIGWTALGVLFLALVGNGLTLMNLSDFAITIVKGLVNLAAALLDAWRVRRRGGS